jgi:hypothetical protein
MRLRLSRGHEAILVSIDDDRVALRAPQAAPPGTRLDATTDRGEPLRLKVARAARDGDGYRIEGRLLDAPRALRDALRDRLSRPPEDARGSSGS